MTNKSKFAQLVLQGKSAFSGLEEISDGPDYFSVVGYLPTSNSARLDVVFKFDTTLDNPLMFILYQQDENVDEKVGTDLFDVKGIVGVSQATKFFNEQIANMGIDVSVYNTEFEFLSFVGRVNHFMAAYSNLGFKSPSKLFNDQWERKGVDTVFQSIDQHAMDNFAIEWLRDYDTALSRQIAHAGHHESLDLLIHLQKDFLGDLLGQSDSSDKGRSPLVTRMLDAYGKEKTLSILLEFIKSL